MSKFMVGDKVEVVNHSNKTYVGKLGEVISIGSGIKPKTQPILDHLPPTETEPRYDVALDDGEILSHLRETQIHRNCEK